MQIFRILAAVHFKTFFFLRDKIISLSGTSYKLVVQNLKWN
jgi:hypothetical protein